MAWVKVARNELMTFIALSLNSGHPNLALCVCLAPEKLSDMVIRTLLISLGNRIFVDLDRILVFD